MNQDLLNKSIELGTTYGIKVLGAIALFATAIWISRLVNRVCQATMQKAKLDITLSRFIGNIIRWTILAISFVSILGIFGVETTSFAAAIAASGLAIGLAFQGTLANFAAGVILLIFRPFKTGHFISVGGHAGTVFEIDLFTTKIDTVDNRRIIIPNTNVFGSVIENMSEHNTRRIDLAIATPFCADVETTREIFKAAATQVPGVLPIPELEVVLIGFGPSCVDWAVRAWVKTDDYWRLREELLVQIKKGLDTARISIPFPQLDVHISQKSPGSPTLGGPH
jgi:small conductance mechanosensitive channel